MTIYERIAAGEFRNQMPYPTVRTTVEKDEVAEMTRSPDLSEQFMAARENFHAHTTILDAKFRAALESEAGMTGHVMRDLLWSQATQLSPDDQMAIARTYLGLRRLIQENATMLWDPVLKRNRPATKKDCDDEARKFHQYYDFVPYEVWNGWRFRFRIKPEHHTWAKT